MLGQLSDLRVATASELLRALFLITSKVFYCVAKIISTSTKSGDGTPTFVDELAGANLKDSLALQDLSTVFIFDSSIWKVCSFGLAILLHFLILIIPSPFLSDFSAFACGQLLEVWYRSPSNLRTWWL